MSTKCEIEQIIISEHEMEHNAASRIFQQDEIVLVAAGSLACVRSLWFQAYRRGKLGQFRGYALPEWKYATGKNEELIYEKIMEASENKHVKGIIVYASCMEYLTQCDLNMEKQSWEQKIPVGILFRGPLTKRNGNPLAALDKLLDKMGLQEKIYEQRIQMDEQGHGELSGIDVDSQMLNSLPPVAPDFSGVLSFLSGINSNAVLISPGGCKSCIEFVDGSGKQEKTCSQHGTRFTDLSVIGGCEDILTTTLCRAFDDEKTIFLIGSAVTQMIGFDGEYLEKCLSAQGKKAVFLKCNGFEGCPEAVDSAMLKIGKMCFHQSMPCQNRQVLITGYTGLAVGEKKVLDPVINKLLQKNMSVQYLGENLDQEIRQLPAVVWMVSGEGYSVSKWMWEEFGIPCVTGRNLGEIYANELAEEIQSCVENPHASEKFHFANNSVCIDAKQKEKLWILGEPVLTSTLFRFFAQNEDKKDIKAAVYVPTPGMRRLYQKLSNEWIYFETQEEMAETVCEGTVIADEFIIRFLQNRHPNINGIAVKFSEISGG